MNPIRIGLAGCGRIAQFHLDALKNLPAYQLSAICDPNLDRATAVSTAWGAKGFSSLQSMLESEQLDLVVLATPSGFHPRQARQCADSGVACLSEKPFGVYLEEAQQVVEYFESKGLPLFVVNQNRYIPVVEKIRGWFDRGLLGKLYMIESSVFWHRPQSYYDTESWRGRRDTDGGAFMNQACHYVDVVQWFGGEVDHVKSEVATFARKIECEDSGALLIRFKSGAIGVLAVTMVAYPENIEGSITFICEKATIKIDGRGLNKLEICRAEDPSVVSEADELNRNPVADFGSGHAEYYRRLVRFFREPNHPEAITGRESLKTLRVLAGIYQEQDHQ